MIVTYLFVRLKAYTLHNVYMYCLFKSYLIQCNFSSMFARVVLWNRNGKSWKRKCIFFVKVLHLHLSSTYQDVNIAEAQVRQAHCSHSNAAPWVTQGQPTWQPRQPHSARPDLPIGGESLLTLSQLSSSLYCICKLNQLLSYKGIYKPTARIRSRTFWGMITVPTQASAVFRAHLL